MSSQTVIHSTPEAIAKSRASVPDLARLRKRIDNHPFVAFGVLSVSYIVIVLVLSSFKLLWLDELITFHIAHLDSVRAIWHALAMGADPNPPVTHILAHYSLRFFGDREFALRLPAVIGYWVGMLSLFTYLRGKVSTSWALSGTLLSMSMAAFDYSYEARSYAIFYGLAMLAFLCWTRAVDDMATRTHRSYWLIGMVGALALGICTNYFAVLAFFPIGAGELTRTLYKASAHRNDTARRNPSFQTRLLHSIDVRVWVGLALASATLLAFRNMIAHSIQEFAPYAWNKVSLAQVSDSYTEMVEIIFYPLMVLLTLVSAAWLLGKYRPGVCSKLQPAWLRRACDRVRLSWPLLPLHEAVGVFFLMLYPVLGYIVASIRGGMLSPRFVIPVCFGFAIAGTLAAHRLLRNVPQAGMFLLCFYLAWFSVREAMVGYWYEEQKQCLYKVIDRVGQADFHGESSTPIVIPDPLMALTFQHYAPPSMSRRAVFPLDFPALRSYRHDDSPERNLWTGRKYLYTLPVMTVASFESKVGDYIILASDGNWFVTDLQDHGYPVERLPINTRAGAIGGFTPLSHGLPFFFRSTGDNRAEHRSLPTFTATPFIRKNNLPD